MFVSDATLVKFTGSMRPMSAVVEPLDAEGEDFVAAVGYCPCGEEEVGGDDDEAPLPRREAVARSFRIGLGSSDVRYADGTSTSSCGGCRKAFWFTVRVTVVNNAALIRAAPYRKADRLDRSSSLLLALALALMGDVVASTGAPKKDAP